MPHTDCYLYQLQREVEQRAAIDHAADAAVRDAHVARADYYARRICSECRAGLDDAA